MHVQDVLPRDSIPSIDEPSFGIEYFADPSDEAIIVEGAPARAYPIRVLSYHEIVNDVLPIGDGADRPIAVTWCPICASGVVFDRRVDGQVLTFGTSGKLADDALVMYDRETESEWKQPLGAAFDGPHMGHRLEVVAASFASVDVFQREHPEGLILQPVHGGNDPAAIYDMAGYDRYEAASGFGLQEMRGQGTERTWNRTDIDAKTIVLGIGRGNEAVGFPITRVREAGGTVRATVGDHDVIVVAVSDGIHAFQDPGFDLTVSEGVLSGAGTHWNPVTGQSTNGRQLDRMPARRLYAFAWQDDHGRDSFFGL